MGRPRKPIGELGDIAFEKEGKVWVARARVRRADGSTYRPRGQGKTKPLAEEALRTKVKDDERKTSTQAPADPSLAELCDLWDQRVVAPSTRLTEATKATYRQHLGRLVAAGGGLRVSECGVMRLEDVLFNRKACPPSQARQRKIVLNGVFQEAMRLGLASANPATAIRVTEYKVKAKDDRGEPLTFTPDVVRGLLELARTFDAAPHRGAARTLKTYPYLAVLLGVGLRGGEVLGLRWRDLDVRASRLTVERSLVWVQNSRVVEKETKSRRGERSISLPAWVRDALVAYRGTRPAAARGRDDFIFPNRDGGPLHAANVRRTFKAMVKDTPYEGLGAVAQTSRRTVGTAVDRAHGAEAAAAHLGNSRAIALSSYLNLPKERADYSGALEGFDPSKPFVPEGPQSDDDDWD